MKRLSAYQRHVLRQLLEREQRAGHRLPFLNDNNPTVATVRTLEALERLGAINPYTGFVTEDARADLESEMGPFPVYLTPRERCALAQASKDRIYRPGAGPATWTYPRAVLDRLETVGLIVAGEYYGSYRRAGMPPEPG